MSIHGQQAKLEAAQALGQELADEASMSLIEMALAFVVIDAAGDGRDHRPAHRWSSSMARCRLCSGR